MEFKRTILVIEDDPAQQRIYRLVLEKAGYGVVIRSEADAGLQWLEQILPDLLILDLMLPGLSGQEMLERIRDHIGADDLPVIVATASPSATASDFRQQEIAEFLQKPLLPGSLVDAVGRAFAH